MSAGYIDSAIETLEDMGYFDETEEDKAFAESLQAENILYLRRLVIELRGGLQEIYAMRGEDDFIASICDPLINKTRDF